MAFRSNGSQPSGPVGPGAGFRRLLVGFASGLALGTLLYLETVRGAVAASTGAATSAIRDELLAHYLPTLVRMNVSFWLACALSSAMITMLAVGGLVVLFAVCRRPQPPGWLLTGVIGLLAAFAHLFVRLIALLSDEPALVVTLWPYDLSRLAPWSYWADGGIVSFLCRWEGTIISAGIIVTCVVALARPRPSWITRRAICICLAMACAGLWCAMDFWLPSGSMATHPAPKSPNVLVLCSDALRADRLGCYGYRERATSPFLDSIAKKSLVFEQCFVPIARTRPSIVSLLTANDPHHHGIRESWRIGDTMTPGIGNYVSLLKEHGYRTAAIGDWCATDLPQHGLEFDRHQIPRDSWNVRTLIERGMPGTTLMLSLLLPDRLFHAVFPTTFTSPGRNTRPHLRDRLREEIAAARKAGKPFFIFELGSTTHMPVSPEGQWLRRFVDDLAPNRAMWLQAFGARDADEALQIASISAEGPQAELVRASYDAAIRSFDDHVRSVFDILEQQQVADRTIVLITSDHGESLFDNPQRVYGHGLSLETDVENHVPCIIYDPRGTGRGMRIPEPVSSLCTFPTIADMIGIEETWPIDGVSLFDSKRQQSSEPPAGCVFMETSIAVARDFIDKLYIPNWQNGTIALRPEFRKETILKRDRCLRTRDYRLLCRPRQDGSCHFLLYDLKRGGPPVPAPQSHQEFPRLKRKLLEWIDNDPLISVENDKISWRRTTGRSLSRSKAW